MERIFQYTITSEYDNKPIDFYLKSMGFSSQNIIELKKMPESILLNGIWVYTRTLLHAGDILTIHLYELSVSDKINCGSKTRLYTFSLTASLFPFLSTISPLLY